MTHDAHRRLRIACAEDDLTQGEFIVAALDARAARLARAAKLAASPLHAHAAGGEA